jgi:hypothetical protein
MSFVFKLFYDFLDENEYTTEYTYSVHWWAIQLIILGGWSGHGVIEMPPRNFRVWTVGNHEESQDSLCPGRGSNRIPTEYE